jgi:hypothetical protein
VLPRQCRHTTAQQSGQPTPEKQPPEDPHAETARDKVRPRRRGPGHPVASRPRGSRTGDRGRTEQSPVEEAALQPRLGPHRRRWKNRLGGRPHTRTEGAGQRPLEPPLGPHCRCGKWSRH